jgi:tetratricopeptide (TPR) repeat protein
VKTAKLFSIALLLGISFVLPAQTPRPGNPDPEAAAEHFDHQNYVMALPIYLALVKKEVGNTEYNYRLGICYLKTNGHKTEAIKYLEFVTKQAKYNNDAWLYLGQAYHYGMRFDEAIKAYETYKKKGDKDGILLADKYIAQCKNAKILVANPLDVSFVNAGKEVNSEYPDYYPYVTSDESMMVFTSRRKGNVGATQVEMDGYFASDIYLTKSVNGVFQKAKGAGPSVNGTYDERCTSLSADGKTMCVYVDNITSAGDIYTTSFKTSFAKIEKLADNPKGDFDRINGGFETAGSYSPDGNMFFFTSFRDGGFGGTDIYMVKKLPGDFGWSLPVNLGANVNSIYNEDSPFMSPDGKTLYFACDGITSMGGFDLFVTVYNPANNTWSTPRNVGYPVNTPGDDLSICFTENNRVAYISSDREGGIGDLDIWRIVFNEIQQNSFTVVTGKFRGVDSTADVSQYEIIVTRSGSDEDYGTYRTNPNTGLFVMALPPGKYILSVSAPGYKPFIETVNVFDIGPQGEMTKDILLVKQ